MEKKTEIHHYTEDQVNHDCKSAPLYSLIGIEFDRPCREELLKTWGSKCVSCPTLRVEGTSLWS